MAVGPIGVIVDADEFPVLAANGKRKSTYPPSHSTFTSKEGPIR